MPRKVVLHCIPSFGGGGAERQLSFLAPAMAAKGWEVHVAHLHGGSNLKSLEGTSVVLHRLPSVGNYDPVIVLRIARLIREVQPAVVQTWLQQMTILGGFGLVRSGIPAILSERCNSFSYTSWWRRGLCRRLGKGFSAVVANSDDGLSFWRGVNDSPLNRVIPNIVPFERLESAVPARVEGMDSGEFRELILFAGRYDPQKNVMRLLSAIVSVVRKRPQACAILCGEGPQLDELVAVRDAAGMRGRVALLGYSEKLWSLMKRATLFVSVSLYEGCPNTVMEAAACGCPLVVSDIPSHRERLDDDSALFVSPFSESEISAGIERCLDTREEVGRRVESARKRAEELSTESVVNRYLELYEILLQRN
ncbi:MAG: glycosyltransferase [Magnetococcales bacterium]|nr:glycosyltransferase [Magnetococcales bacterium]